MNIIKSDNSYIIEEKSAKKINHKNSMTLTLKDGIQVTIVRLSHGAKGKQANIRVARLIFDGNRFNEDQVKDYCSRYQIAYYDLNFSTDKLTREIKEAQYISDHEVVAVIVNGTPKDETLSQRLRLNEDNNAMKSDNDYYMDEGMAKLGTYYQEYQKEYGESHDISAAIGVFNSLSLIQKPDDRDLVAVYFDVIQKCANKQASYKEIQDGWDNGPRLFRLFDIYAETHPVFDYLDDYLTFDEAHRKQIDEMVSFIDSLTGNYSDVSLSVTYGSQQAYMEESYHDQEMDHLFNIAQMTAALSAMYKQNGGAIVGVTRKSQKDQYYGFAAKDGSLVTLSAENLKWAMSQQADGSDANADGEFLEAPLTLDATVVRGE